MYRKTFVLIINIFVVDVIFEMSYSKISKIIWGELLYMLIQLRWVVIGTKIKMYVTEEGSKYNFTSHGVWHRRNFKGELLKQIFHKSFEAGCYIPSEALKLML
jgi:hypothetical protein